MEEENILDEHQPTSCSNDGEETVQDARRHVRVEGGGSGAPSCCTDRQALKEDQYGEATEVGGEPDHEDTASAEHKDVPSGGMIDDIGVEMPFLSLWKQSDGTSGTAIVGRARGNRNDEQDYPFLSGRPVERVGGIVARLWGEDRVAVECLL